MQRLVAAAGSGRVVGAVLMPPPPRSSSSAGWPVSARKTSSRLGWASEKLASPSPARDSSATASAARSASSTRTDSARRIGLELWLGVERAGEHPRGLAALLRVEQAHVQRAAADRRLQPRRRALGDDLAAVDDGDPVGELVGLVEVLRAEQDGRALGDERADDVPHLVARARVEARRRLVEEHELGRRRRCSRRCRAAGACRRSSSSRAGRPRPRSPNASSSSSARARACFVR